MKNLAQLIDKALKRMFANPPMVTSDGDTVEIDYGSIVVSPTEDGYVIEAASLVKGVRTFPNGDPGFPDDIDFNEVLRIDHKNPQQVIQKIMEMWFWDNCHEIGYDVVLESED